MKFWDSSAVIPLLLDERYTQPLLRYLDLDPSLLVWWTTRVEAASAIARLERERKLSLELADKALLRLGSLAQTWDEIQPDEEVRQTAMRLLRVHRLRAGDSLQLAAALTASERRPETLEFVCLDQRLAQAAKREGFSLVSP